MRQYTNQRWHQEDQFIYESNEPEPSDLQTPSHGFLMKHQHLKMCADHDLEFLLKESSRRLETQTQPPGVKIDLQEVDPQLQGSSKIKIPLQKPPLSRQEPRKQGPAPVRRPATRVKIAVYTAIFTFYLEHRYYYPSPPSPLSTTTKKHKTNCGEDIYKIYSKQFWCKKIYLSIYKKWKNKLPFYLKL